MTGVAGESRYFTVSVIEPLADLRISVTSFWGDADLFVNPASAEGLPSADSYTWASFDSGSNLLVLQAEDTKEFCTPDPAAGAACDYNVAVYSWANATYSVRASLSRGWSRPQRLGVGEPQLGQVATGEYAYYEVRPVGCGADWCSAAPHVLVVTATPLDMAQLDLFLTTNRSRQPGPAEVDHDAAAAHARSAGEFLIYGPGDKGYCRDCEVYLAVFGAEGGVFSVVASVGMTRLTVSSDHMCFS
ncbi:unnamed protein product [Phaeothamnion confervicola]